MLIPIEGNQNTASHCPLATQAFLQTADAHTPSPQTTWIGECGHLKPWQQALLGCESISIATSKVKED